MSLFRFPPVPFTANNLSDTELARHVEHHYPDLAGPLRILLQRFERRASEHQPELTGPGARNCCPHCGTTFEDS